uniref:Serine/threonine-protein kinase TOR n=1 Tax=Trichuris muris TaxID=70415 RepID=A0A5S6QLG6_TRIMR
MTSAEIFLEQLCSKSQDDRVRSANELFWYINCELKDMPVEAAQTFLEKFDCALPELLSSNEPEEKIAAIFAIVCLMQSDRSVSSIRVSRFTHYLRKMLPMSDLGLVELAIRAGANLALSSSGTYASEYVEFEIKRALEWLSEANMDKNEAKRFSAAVMLRELACIAPTFFFQHMSQFFDCIFEVLKDSKVTIRERATEALRAALVVASQREIKVEQKIMWYKLCYDQAVECFTDARNAYSTIREDRVNSALLIINELLRNGNSAWEKTVQSVEQMNSEQFTIVDDERSSASFEKQVVLTSQDNIISRLVAPAYVGMFESRTCRKQLTECYEEMCRHVARCRNVKSLANVQILLKTTTRLAAFDPERFSALNFPESVNFVLSGISREKQRSDSLLATGLLFIAMKKNMEPYVSKVFDLLKQQLPAKEGSKKRTSTIDPSLFTCVALIVRAFGSSVHDHIKHILDSMLATGLSSTLTFALREICVHMESLKKAVHRGLLEQLYQILLHQQMPASITVLQQVSFPSQPVNASNVQLITLALKILATFPFQRCSLEAFLRWIPEGYLGSEFYEVRLEAVRCLCRILVPFVESLYPAKDVVHNCALLRLVHDIVMKVLTVAITDPDDRIRQITFNLLVESESFHCHLAQADVLQLVVMGLQDRKYEIREAVVILLGRMCDINPAYVVPSLRRVLLQVFDEMNHSGLSRNEEQSARLFAQLVSSAPKFMRPYTQTAFEILVPKLQNVRTQGDVIVSFLRAIGELAGVMELELQNYLSILLPALMQFTQDASSSGKRRAALWALSQVIKNAGFLMEPAKEYPDLLEMLLRLLKTEQSHAIRREVIRLVGLIGALDPYKEKQYSLRSSGASNSTGLALSLPEQKGTSDRRQEIIQWFHWERCSLDEFFPTLAIVNLISILADPSLSQHHHTVVNALVFIFYSLNVKCDRYMDQVVPHLINLIRSADPTMREFLFQQFGYLVSVVKHHIKPYLSEVFDLIKEFWTPQTPMRLTIIMLLEQLASALGSQFKPYVTSLMPSMLRVFLHDTSEGRAVTAKLLDALKVTSCALEDHFHMLIPSVLKVAEQRNVPLNVRRSAIETIDVFGESSSLSSFASRIIQTLIVAMDSSRDLHGCAMDLVCTLLIHMGRDFLPFRRVVDHSVARNHIYHPRYNALLVKVTEVGKVNPYEDATYKTKVTERREKLAKDQQIIQIEVRKSTCNLDYLRKIWSVSRCASKEDWIEWLKRFSIELLKESPVPALRSCYSVAQNYSQLATDLFNSAFSSCWTALSESAQNELIKCLETAISNPECPEVTQAILNLSEFVDHTEKGPLPINPLLLGEKALETRAYAKALRYKENEFVVEVSSALLESILSINNQLQLPEASIGIVEYARKHGIKISDKECWYEKLHDWEKALEAYEKKQELHPKDMDITLGRMRCLEALGEWGKLNDIVKENWSTCEPRYKRTVARIAASAAWGLGQWDPMRDYVSVMNHSSVDGCFYQAVLAVEKGNFSDAHSCIDTARDLIDTELTAMVSESYNRAYETMVTVQMLSELEEAIEVKKEPKKRDLISKVWRKRLQDCQSTVEDWQRLLQVRSLVFEPHEMLETWIKYASLCRKSGKMAMSRRTLVSLLGVDPDLNETFTLPQDNPILSYAYCKQLHSEGREELAIAQLKKLLDTSFKKQGPSLEVLKLKAKCFVKLGMWTEASRVSGQPVPANVMEYYKFAAEMDPETYKPWHALACANFNSLLYYKEKGECLKQSVVTTIGEAGDNPVSEHVLTETTVNDNIISMHAIQAVQCFCRSVVLCKGNSLQDTLRLLTVWFDYGHIPEVYDVIVDRIKTVSFATWLQVIPQLIARIDTPRTLVSRSVIQLLCDIGKEHPQALIYPITIASKSENAARKQAASNVLKHMSDHSPRLVQQAFLVSEELVRVAILWHEMWHEGLEEASRLYFAERNLQGMFSALEPLHKMIERGATTIKEQSFNQAYYRDLKEAQDLCTKRISKQLPLLTTLDLQYVAPKLLLCQNLELAVPGTYDPFKPVVCIQSVRTDMQVIASKQRPRKVCIKGSDGQDYWFLLKGHEDPRQDERVMQLFGLINTMLLENPMTCRRNLTISRYSIIPLSQNSGLIGWMPNCDTLHALLRDYREKKKILLNIEHKLMQRMSPDFEHLTVVQKIEVFEHALEHTTGDDLRRILWLKSPSSEIWFERRTTYTRSLATVSMVGYILGLGDRHPSNLMLDRMSGKMVHIDFGDCFEVAMIREKFPEKIPFRLTRMLVSAMEVTGVEGNFRLTCENVLSVLRENRESIVAVLEAFVYDPLLNWRLLEHCSNREPSNETRAADSPFEHFVHPSEVVSRKALEIVQRIRNKLTGRDFIHLYADALDVPAQVEVLIQQATAHENLCQCYVGWCPFW